jgi:hypothetical protein
MAFLRWRAGLLAGCFVAHCFDFAERYSAAAWDDSRSAAAPGDSQYLAAELRPAAQAEPSSPAWQP